MGHVVKSTTSLTSIRADATLMAMPPSVRTVRIKLSQKANPTEVRGGSAGSGVSLGRRDISLSGGGDEPEQAYL